MTGLLFAAVPQSEALPTVASPVVIGVALLYFLAVAGIANWASRRTRSAEDFFLGGKSIGLFALTLTAMATTFTGFTFVGGPGYIFSQGLGAMLFVLPASITNALAAWVVAKRLRLLAEIRPVMTIPGVIGLRYQSRLAHGLSAGGVIIGVVGYMGTNVLALGVVMDALFGIGIAPGIWIGTVIVVAYAAGGGILAGIYTDVLQGLVMTIASVLVFFYAVQVGGGMGHLSVAIMAVDPDWASPWGVQSTLGAVGLYFLFSVGAIGQPHVVHKFFMVKDPRELRWYPLTVTIAMIIVILLMLGVGMAVKYLTIIDEMTISDPDTVAPLFLLAYTPTLLAAVVFAGMAAAIMSSVDAFLNVGAAAITLDIPNALGRPLKNELRWARISTAGLALAAAITATLSADTLVVFLGIFGYGVFAATLMPGLALGLNWGGATRAGAVASISTGLIVTLGLESLRYFGFIALAPGVSASAIALISAILVFLAVSAFTRGGTVDELDEDVQLALKL